MLYLVSTFFAHFAHFPGISSPFPHNYIRCMSICPFQTLSVLFIFRPSRSRTKNAPKVVLSVFVCDKIVQLYDEFILGRPLIQANNSLTVYMKQMEVVSYFSEQHIASAMHSIANYVNQKQKKTFPSHLSVRFISVVRRTPKQTV